MSGFNSDEEDTVDEANVKFVDEFDVDNDDFEEVGDLAKSFTTCATVLCL